MNTDDLKTWKEGLVGLIREREMITETFVNEADFWAEMEKINGLSRDLRMIARKKLEQRYGAPIKVEPAPEPTLLQDPYAPEPDPNASRMAQRFAPGGARQPVPPPPSRAQALASDIVSQINDGSYANGYQR